MIALPMLKHFNYHFLSMKLHAVNTIIKNPDARLLIFLFSPKKNWLKINDLLKKKFGINEQIFIETIHRLHSILF